MYNGYFNGQNSEEDEKKDENKPVETLKELGEVKVPEFKSDIYVMTIIGQIEGHIMLPPQNKATKYEHIIPQIVAVEESNEIEGLLLILNTVGGAFSRINRLFLHSSYGNYDHTPNKNERPDYRSSANL